MEKTHSTGVMCSCGFMPTAKPLICPSLSEPLNSLGTRSANTPVTNAYLIFFKSPRAVAHSHTLAHVYTSHIHTHARIDRLDNGQLGWGQVITAVKHRLSSLPEGVQQLDLLPFTFCLHFPSTLTSTSVSFSSCSLFCICLPSGFDTCPVAPPNQPSVILVLVCVFVWTASNHCSFFSLFSLMVCLLFFPTV